MKKRISVEIIVPVLFLVGFSIILCGVFSFVSTKSLYNSKIRTNYVLSLSQSLSSRCNAIITPAVQASLLLTKNPQVVEWAENGLIDERGKHAVLALLDTLVHDLPYYSSFLALDKTKEYWSFDYKLLQLLDKNNTTDSWYFNLINGKEPYYLYFDYNAKLHNSYLFVNALVKNGGKNLGITGVGIDITNLQKSFADMASQSGALLFLVDEKNSVLVTNETALNGKPLDAVLTIPTESGDSSVIPVVYNKVHYLVHSNRLTDARYRIVAAYPEKN